MDSKRQFSNQVFVALRIALVLALTVVLSEWCRPKTTG